MRVLKFGGAALRDGPATLRAASLVRERGGARPVVVVSAHEGVTELLDRALEDALCGTLSFDPVRVRHRTILRQLELPGDFLDRHLAELRAVLGALCADRRADRRLRDHVLSFGERMSARVVAAILRRQGCEATPMDAFDLGLVARGGGLEHPERAAPALSRAVLGGRGVAVVTGFLALDDAGHVTTLGRNGSDLTAAWFAAALGAEEIQLWKEVPGLLSADPRLVPHARHVAELGWAEAEELARHGAQVLHPGALELAARARIPVRLLDVNDSDAPGSLVAGESGARGPLALAHRPRLARFTVRLDAARDRGAELSEILAAFSAQSLEPYLGRIGAGSFEAFVPSAKCEARVERAVAALGTQGARDGGERVRAEDGFASLALVGPGVAQDERVETELARLAGEAELPTRLEPPELHARSRVLLTRSEALAPLVARVHEALFDSALLAR
jgi:aspartate kinase